MLASVIGALFFLGMALLFPHREKPVKDYDKLILLNGYKYKIYEIFSIVPLFFFISVICYVFYLLGNDVQEVYFGGREADFAIYPPDAFWLVPGIFFGFGLIIPPMELLYRLMLQEEYDAYIEYTNRKHGIDDYKVVRVMCLGSVVAGVVLSVLGLGWYKEIKGDRLIIDDFDSIGPQEYRAQDITAITHFDKYIKSAGVAEERPHYKIVFSDGRVWDTSSNFHEVRQEQYAAIVDYLVARTNLEVAYREAGAAAE